MKKLIISINLFKKVELSMKSFVRFIAVLSALALLSGCGAGGLLVDSMGKTMVTDKTYGEMATALPPPTDGKGRLYIYRTEASTKTSLHYGIGFEKNPTLYTVDNIAYELIWEAFKYIDLPEGQHEVTCGRDIVKKVDFWGRGYFQKGENRIQVSILNASETFIRVDGTKEKPFFKPCTVNRSHPIQPLSWIQFCSNVLHQNFQY